MTGKTHLCALVAGATMLVVSASSADSRPKEKPPNPTGVWECYEQQTGAPFLVSFFADGNLRTTFPDQNVSTSHAIWRTCGGKALTIDAKALVYQNGSVAGIGTSHADAQFNGPNILTAQVRSSYEFFDGTVLENPDFTLECMRSFP